MDQIWLLLSLTALVTGFGLVVALIFLKRLAPLSLPPVITAILALLFMGTTSFFGVYLRVLSLPRSILPYRLLNAGAWGFAAYSMLWFILRSLRDRGNNSGKDSSSGRERSSGDIEQHIFAATLGLIIFLGAMLSAHPPADGLLSQLPALKSGIMIVIEAVVGVLAVLVGLRSLRWCRRTTSRPWRAYLRGFGISLLVLVPANLLDFGVTMALRLSGTGARDGLVFAAGYGVVNIILIASIIQGVRLSGAGEIPALPQSFLDAYGITRREKEVIEKLLQGKTDRRIGEELYISPRTVDTHLRSVFRKCQISSRLQLTRLVSSYGEFRNSR